VERRDWRWERRVVVVVVVEGSEGGLREEGRRTKAMKKPAIIMAEDIHMASQGSWKLPPMGTKISLLRIRPAWTYEKAVVLGYG